jgi:hypothetical protein
MHSKLAWPSVLDKFLGLNVRESQLMKKATFDDSGSYVVGSLSEVELTQYQAILFYDGLRRHLQAIKNNAIKVVVMSHADMVDKVWKDTTLDKDKLIFETCDQCISALSKAGHIDKDKSKQVDRAELAFLTELAERGISVSPSTDETDSTETEEEDIPTGTILLKSDANIMKAVADLINNAEISEDEIDGIWQNFENICKAVGVDYSDAIATLEGEELIEELEEVAA